MSVDVEPLNAESDRPTCRVYTKDATGNVRTYRVELGPEQLDGKPIMGARLVDGDLSVDVLSGASQAVWNAARKHFEANGHEVHQ